MLKMGIYNADEKKVIVGGRYRHFKGGEYVVLGVARSSDTLEHLVVYQGTYYSKEFGNQPIWTRPLSDFLGEKVLEDAKKSEGFLAQKEQSSLVQGTKGSFAPKGGTKVKRFELIS